MDEVLLGVHCSYIDGAFAGSGNVTLLRNGKIEMAIAQERVTRRKYDGGFSEALKYVLDRTKTKPADIAAVGVSTFGLTVPPSDCEVQEIFTLVRKALPGFKGTVHIAPSHHEIHALAAASTCGSENALIAIIDNEGSLLDKRQHQIIGLNKNERTSYYRLLNGSLSLVARDHAGQAEVGYGKLYSKVTQYIGFKSYHESGKTMGLAPFGRGDKFSECILYSRDGMARTSMWNTEAGLGDISNWFLNKGILLPPVRQQNEPLRRIDADLAYWVQNELEESVLDRLKGLVSEHKPQVVCMAGGVALNSVMNAKLRNELGVKDVIVPPSPGDPGLSVGAVSWLIRERTGAIPNFGGNPYLGGTFSIDDFVRAAEEIGGVSVRLCDNVNELAAEALARGEIVTVFSGASEFGPRALGNRSILANPSNSWTVSLLNNQVKNREWFRPYAPAILEERCSEHFVSGRPTPYMMHIDHVKADSVAKCPAIVHVDGTARLQTISKAISPNFHELVSAFSQKTGLPVVLNTSFNLGGEPIVETPADALKTFLSTPWLDALYAPGIEVRSDASRAKGSISSGAKLRPQFG